MTSKCIMEEKIDDSFSNFMSSLGAAGQSCSKTVATSDSESNEQFLPIKANDCEPDELEIDAVRGHDQNDLITLSPLKRQSHKQQDDVLLEDLNSSMTVEEKHSYSFEKKEHEKHVYDPSAEEQNKFQNRSLSLNQNIPISTEGGKWYSKSNCCLYCKRLYSKIVEHLCTAHSSEILVKKASLLKINSLERRSAFGNIRLMGNDLYNNNIDINPEKKLIVSRRLRKKSNKNNSPIKINFDQPEELSTVEQVDDKNVKHIFKKVVCARCRIYCAPSYLTSHLCHGNKVSIKAKDRQNLSAALGAMGLCHPVASVLVRDIFLPKLKMDDVGLVARYDFLIVKFFNKYAPRYASIDQQAYLRNHVRLLGKLLIALKQLTPQITELKSAFDAEHWPSVLQAILNVSEYDSKRNRFIIIFNAETIPILIRKLIRILRSHFTIEKDEDSQKLLEGFNSVFENEVESEVSYTAGQSRREFQRHQQEKDLPATDEIHTFASFLREVRQNAVEKFTENKNYEEWLTILSTTSVLLILYNRRRAGETGKALIVDFQNRKKANPSSEFFKMLPKEEQVQRLKYARIDIQGKRIDGAGQLFISEKNEEMLTFCLKWRGNVGVDPDNPYLFGVKTSSLGEHQHLKLYNLLVKYADECAESEQINPKVMRGNNLRHQLATYTSSIDNGTQRKVIVYHMGHSENTHNKFYRRAIDQEDAATTSVLDKANKINNRENVSSEELNESTPCTSAVSEPVHEDLKKKANYKRIRSLPDSSDEEENFKQSHKKKAIIQKVKKQSSGEKTKSSKKRWDSDEIEAFEKAFSKQLLQKVNPTANDIKKALNNFPELVDRGAPAIRTRFSNIYKKN